MSGITGMLPRTAWPWKDIPNAYKTTDQHGVRWVLVWDDRHGTCLAPWKGIG